MDDYNKQCSRCQEIKGRSEFSKDKRAKDGLTSACLKCYRLANKKTGDKYATSWAPRSPDDDYSKRCTGCKEVKHHTLFGVMKRRKDGLRNKCKDCHNSDNCVWRINNKDTTVKYWKDVASHKNRGDYHKNWKIANRQKCNEYEHRRRARKANIPCEPIDVELLYKRDNGRCYLCGEPITFEEMVQEHKIPLSRTELNPSHTYDNLGVSCQACNMSKGNKTVEEYLEWRTC